MTLLDNTANQPCKYIAKNWLEINNDWCGVYDLHYQNYCKTSIRKSSNVITVTHK